MYKRDFGILFLAACAVFLSLQNEGPFTFKKAWYYHFTEADVNHWSDALDEHLAPPVSADLNGDGKPEVIAATPNGALVVLAPRRPGDGFASALVLHEVDLEPLLETREPVVVMSLATGYITPHPSDLVRALRKQIVVAVTEDGHVIALDHNLKLLWKQSLDKHMPHGGRLIESAILITEHAVNKGDKGLVVIGVRAEPDTLADDVEEDDFLEEEIIAEGLERAHEHGREKAAKLEEVNSGRHFSYFAFTGDKGELRWKHEALDFHRDLVGLQEATVSTQHSLHTAAQLQDGIHYGEASCREYREAVLAALPHMWHSSRDTKLQLAHFHKHRAHHGSQKERISAASSSPPTQKLISTTKTTTTTTKKSTVSPPNVVLAHVEEGIEAVHLFTGRTVCRLYLDPFAMHVDLNGDGIPDHVHAVGGSPANLVLEGAEEDADDYGNHRRLRFCAAFVSSGIPPKAQIWNGTICRPMRFGFQRAQRMGYVEVAPPMALPVPGKGGHYRQQLLRQKNNAIFLTSRGDLTAYSSKGDLLWQVLTGASWHVRMVSDDIDVDDEDLKNVVHQEEDEMSDAQPTLLPMALRRHAIPSVILVAGDDELSLVSEHGHELVTLELPENPAQPLSVLDFNLDGYNDLIMLGHGGIYGWTQVRRPGAVPFSALVGVLIVIMLTVFVMQQGFMQPGGKGKGRSTDRTD